jgi:DNA repair photolyase
MAGASEEARAQLRWRLADESTSPQQALFAEEPPHWRAGHGEFRGLEFLEVRAKRVVNEVPQSSRVPFRYTINAYRGCSHRCVYCLSGETAVLMADGRTKALAEIRSGDAVYGTAPGGSYRRYVTTTVVDHWQTYKPAYRIVLQDGTELIASGDHRFWTGRAKWKFVTGAEQGALRRPHLTLNDSLIGTGAFASAPKLDADYKCGYLCGIVRGDGHLRSKGFTGSRGGPWVRNAFRLALVDLEALERTKSYLLEFGVPTANRLFQAAFGARKAMHSISNCSEAGVTAITETVRWPVLPSQSWAKGFLAGIFDAEGTYGDQGILRIANTDREIIGWIESCLTRFGFPYVVEDLARPNGMKNVRLTGGIKEHLRFFHLTDPAITRKRSIEGRTVKPWYGPALKIENIEPTGLELPLYDITTGTGDFIANGVISHNCFARPTHEYLNLNAGEDFDRKIVVKVNAVERVRAEVAAKRWAGELIAMGTNTDPYQRCEGKYRLTRGIVEVLGEARNPFSILTKSSLILRDVDVLAEAAQRTRVQVAFSVGTVDDEVWKLSEPGTPHPRRRLEALVRLREAGIPTGVLAAPILPGISDSPAQLEALAKALVEAGVESASPIVLHLRPGVKQEYVSWLANVRPDLLIRYDEIYGRRAYAPRAIQEEISARFHAAFDAIRPGSR